MLTASKFCFAALLAAFLCQTQARHDGDSESEDFRNFTRCSWNCKVIDSGSFKQTKTIFAKSKVIQVVVIYRKKVDEKSCVNQVPFNSSRVTIENWQTWRPANPSSNFAHIIDRVLNLLFSSHLEEKSEIKVDCNITRTPCTMETNRDSVLPEVIIQGHLATDLEVNFESINMSNSTGNNTDNQLNRSEGWEDANLPLGILVVVLFTAFLYYSPAFLCFFSPTLVTKNGVRYISLEGASPVSLRYQIANYFYSEVDNLRHKTKKLIAQAVLVPLPFLVPAVVFYHMIIQRLQRESIPVRFRFILDFSQPFMLVCLISYFLQAVYDSFFNVTPIKTPCFVCRSVKSNLTCNDKLPRRILNHLRIQPLIIMKCWRLFCRRHVSYCKISRVILPSWKASISWFLRVPILIVFLSTIPIVTVLLLAGMLIAALFSILFLTSPFIILTDVTRVNVDSGSVFTSLPVLVFLRIFVTSPAIVGATLVLFGASLTFFMVIATLFILLLSEKGLPYVVCFVLILYYLLSSYSSFVNKYQDLSLMLFKFYKQLRIKQYDQISDDELPMNLEQIDTPNSDTRGVVVRIPQDLFDVACDKLMPLRESVGILFLKVILILTFVSLTFLFILRFNIGATPVMRALATFFTGSFPKILGISGIGDRQRKLKATIIEEKIPEIVRDYVNGTSNIYEMVAGDENGLVDDQSNLFENTV